MRPTSPLTVDQWRKQGGPSYSDVFRWRLERIEAISSSDVLKRGANEYYATHPVEFVSDWLSTFDPRSAGRAGRISLMPFVLFHRQAELIEFIHFCRKNEINGIIPKSRDMGATWGCTAYSVWLWLFVPGATIGWGSRKEQLVDKLGVPDTIFEKMRIILKWLPAFLLPRGFNPKIHCTYMRIINPENGNVITGEAGDNIGRGGRNLIYFKDEAAFFEHPELIESALNANTNVQIDISSAGPSGNVFHRRFQASIPWQSGMDPDAVRSYTVNFVMKWTDHPSKTVEWYENMRDRYKREGLSHIFAREVDINFNASQSNVVIPMEWLRSCVDAHTHLDIPVSGGHFAALDVADEGGDTNAYSYRTALLLRHVEEWGDSDTTVSAQNCARRLAEIGKSSRVVFNYDSIGVGAGIKGEMNRLRASGKIGSNVQFSGWNAAGAVPRPFDRMIQNDRESPLRGDFFQNAKSSAWWDVRTRCFKTHQMIQGAAEYPMDELISFSTDIPLLEKLLDELGQTTFGYSASTGKLLIEKKPNGAKSPNLADSVIILYNPLESTNARPIFGMSSST